MDSSVYKSMDFIHLNKFTYLNTFVIQLVHKCSDNGPCFNTAFYVEGSSTVIFVMHNGMVVFRCGHWAIYVKKNYNYVYRIVNNCMYHNYSLDYRNKTKILNFARAGR